MERQEKMSHLKRASGSAKSLPTLVKTSPTSKPQASSASSLDSFDIGDGMTLKIEKKKERGFYVERNASQDPPTKGPPTKDGASAAVLDHDPPKLRSVSAGPTTRHVSFGTLEETKKDMSNIYNPSAKRSTSQGRVTGLHQRSDSKGLVDSNHQRSTSTSLRNIKSSLSLRRVSSNITDLALRGTDALKCLKSPARAEERTPSFEVARMNERLELRGRRPDRPETPCIAQPRSREGSPVNIPVLGHIPLGGLRIMNPDPPSSDEEEEEPVPAPRRAPTLRQRALGGDE